MRGSEGNQTCTRSGKLPEICKFVALILFLAASCPAQNYVPAQPDNALTPADPIGVPPKPSTAGTFEAVGNTNGGLSFFLPVLSLPQRGGWTLTLGYYNTSPEWSLRQDVSVAVNNYPPCCSPTATTMTYNENFQQSANGGPLGLNLPTLQASLEYTGDAVVYISGLNQNLEVPVVCLTNWVFTDWSGNKHQFTNRAVCSAAGNVTGNGAALQLSSVGDSTDGSWLSLDTSNYTSQITVRTKDGTAYQFPGATNPFSGCSNSCYLNNDAASSQDSYYYLPFSSMSDPNGNTVTYNSSASTLTDTIGRVISVGSGGITYTDSNGTSETIQVTRTSQASQTYPITPALSCQPYADPTYVKVTIENSTLSSVTAAPFTYTIALPAADSTGSKRVYTLQFDGLDNLTQITYPGSGYTKYTYQFNSGYKNVQGLVECTQPGEEIAQRRECPSGSCSGSQELVTTYTPDVSSKGPYNIEMVVTDALGDVTDVGIQNLNTNYATYQHNTGDNTVAAHEVWRIISAPNGTPLRTIQTAYIPYVFGADVEVPSQVTTFLDDVSPAISSVTNYQYEPYTVNGWATYIDNPTETDEYDYSGSLVKKTAQTWEAASAFTTPHMLDRLQSRTITDPASSVQATLSYGYDTHGNIISKTVGGTSVGSLTTNYQRDSYGNITQATDPNNNITKFGYTDNWADSACSSLGPSAYLTSITDALNHVTNFSYYSCTGLKASATDPNSRKTSYSYDALGRPVSTSFPDNGGTSISYVDAVPNSFTQSELITSGLSRIQTTILDGFDRKIETQLTSDPDGTDYVDTTYDSLGRVATASNPYRTSNDAGPTNGTTTYNYDALDRTIKVTDPDGSTVSTAYSGNMTTVTDEAGKSRKSESDALGRLTNVWEDPAGLNYQTIYSYDAFGNLTNVVQNGSRQRAFSYNAFSQLVSATNPESGTITYAYDNDGNLITKTSPAENQTNTTSTPSNGSFSICCSAPIQDQGTVYVTVGSFNAQVDYDNTSTANSVASALADALNGSGLVNASAFGSTINMTSITDGTAANYSLDSSSVGNLDPPKFSATPSGSTMTGGSDPPSLTLTYSYDALNRVTKKTYTDGTPTATYGYDGVSPTGCSPSLTITNGIYRRTGMCDAMGMEAWSYDPMGRALTDRRTTSGITRSTGYTYNLDGSTASLTYPSGRTITYLPGGAGLPLSAVDSANSINYATSAHYDPAGALASLQNGSNLYSTYIYNNRLQPCWMYSTTGTALPWSTTQCGSTDPGPGNILDLKYSFNLGTGDNGNVVGITNDRDGTRSQGFGYDTLNRLTGGWTTSTYATSPSNCWGESYQFDNQTTGGAWGNLTSIGVESSAYNGCVQENLNVAATTSNRISGYCYDAAGNLLQQGTCPAGPPYTYTYNAVNQITSTAGVTYSYDGDGRRVEKSGGTVYWYGMSSDAFDETDLSGNLKNEYVFFDGRRIARRDSSGNIFYYFADHLGTSREIVQAGQSSPCYDADFFPFGGERTPMVNSCSTSQNYKFTGKERDSESGLDNFGARYDSSQYGRFMTPDPSSVDGDTVDSENPQSWNMYSYVLNNPVSAVDPDGLDYYLLGGDQCGETVKCDKRGYVEDEYGDRAVVTDQQILNGDYTLGTDANGNTTITTGNGTFQAQFFDSKPFSVQVNSNGDDVPLNSFAQQALGQAGQMADAGVKLDYILVLPEYLVATGGTGLVELSGEGIASLGLSGPTEGQVSSISRAAAQGGRNAVEKALRSYEKLLAEHEADLANYKAAGGYTSSVESEIENFKGLIQAAKDWLSKNP